MSGYTQQRHDEMDYSLVVSCSATNLACAHARRLDPGHRDLRTPKTDATRSRLRTDAVFQPLVQSGYVGSLWLAILDAVVECRLAPAAVFVALDAVEAHGVRGIRRPGA